LNIKKRHEVILKQVNCSEHQIHFSFFSSSSKSMMMNYPYPITASPYIQAAMSQAVQAYMIGAPLPSNCTFMAMQLPSVLPSTPYYTPSPHTHPPAPRRPQNYNYPIVPYTPSSKKKPPQQLIRIFTIRHHLIPTWKV